MHKGQPGAAHQALMGELHGVLDRFGAGGMPKIEQIAVMAQAIGQKISALDAKVFTPVEVLESVMLNIISGNDQAAAASSPLVSPASGLVGFGG